MYTKYDILPPCSLSPYHPHSPLPSPLPPSLPLFTFYNVGNLWWAQEKSRIHSKDSYTEIFFEGLSEWIPGPEAHSDTIFRFLFPVEHQETPRLMPVK